jgi:predicted nucleic acid-binding protein
VIVLVDTDVLIDLALDRAPHAEPAAQLLDALEAQPGHGFVAWHSLSNFFYMVAPSRGKGGAKDFLLDLTRFLAVAPTTTESFQTAGRLDLSDFEDAMQVAAALACGAGVIATRNLRDYARSPVQAVKPSAAVALLLDAGSR